MLVLHTALPAERMQSLEAHFSRECESLIQRLDQQIVQLEALVSTCNDIKLPHKAALYNDMQDAYDDAILNFKAPTKNSCDVIARIVSELEKKGPSPSSYSTLSWKYLTPQD